MPFFLYFTFLAMDLDEISINTFNELSNRILIKIM